MAPPQLPPNSVPSLVVSLTVRDLTADQVTITWQPPASDGGLAIEAYRAWVCDVNSDDCIVTDVPASQTTAMVAVSARRNVTVAVEALNAFGSSGNATVGAVDDDNGVCHVYASPTCAGPDEPCYYDPACSLDTVSLGCNAGGGHHSCRFCGFGGFESIPCPSNPAHPPGEVFTTQCTPSDGLEPFLAQPQPALDNETTMHIWWWAPFDNGLPLEQHELTITPPDTTASGGDVVCTTSAVDGVILDPACSRGPEYSTHCGAGGHPLCRACSNEVGQQPCSNGRRHALGDADALSGGTVRIRVAHSDLAARLQQIVLYDMIKGTEYIVTVRARNEHGWGAPSPPVALRTAGDPPPPPSTLSFDSAAALSAEGEGAFTLGPILAGSVLLLCCCCGAYAYRRFIKRFRVRKRDPTTHEVTIEDLAEEVEEVPRWALPPPQRLRAVMNDPLSSIPIPIIEEQANAKPQVNQVLVYLAKQEKKRLKEEEQKERAAEAERKRKEKEEAISAPEVTRSDAANASRRVSKIGYKPGRNIGKLGLNVMAKNGDGGAESGGDDLESYLRSKGLIQQQSKARLTPEEKQKIAREAALLGVRAEMVAHKPHAANEDMSAYYKKASWVASETRQILMEDADESLEWPELMSGTGGAHGGGGDASSGAAGCNACSGGIPNGKRLSDDEKKACAAAVRSAPALQESKRLPPPNLKAVRHVQQAIFRLAVDWRIEATPEDLRGHDYNAPENNQNPASSGKEGPTDETCAKSDHATPPVEPSQPPPDGAEASADKALSA